ncbi:holo-ACP synthase [Sulfurisoma sediminicola]|uniref:Holo-[acyl-carrier-protein] synthase n=1 Tax=Sulfurisoma sediminicola TaxID=1381557 RepID=A0A497XDA9_9PROT|nr:holo-ACP synthase [Sulfurisoma sediminicola]RLJ64982.1 holo-[acyl-carrier protein] synthase [Sulfurisoma sediminicola]
MIFGIGTDIVAVARMADLWASHGERALEKLLGPGERAACRAAGDPARFLAKRFAAKEALGKACGIGIRAPVLLPRMEITHDAAGKPHFVFLPPLASWMQERGLTAHLSISDEADAAVAFVILEQR